MNEHTQAILKEALIEAMKINDDGLLMSSERDWIRSHVVKDFFKILTAQENSELNSEVSCQEGWISVEDRLPLFGEYVLVTYPYADGFGRIVKLATFTKSCRDNRGCFAKYGWWNEDTCEMIECVDKWCRYQPLPAPPKEGE
ncbi:MAG: hypothetical protein DRO67_01655 [Candidatus Asgardarchaeum californiense]|nr:MAG: hypothetical protein DRO67_01655 [Candidatus Asgardarchaeum californiense]